jgi:hypothetical protein
MTLGGKGLFFTSALDRGDILTSGFGGLWLACWPLVPKIAGLNPVEAVRFFGQKNPQHAFLQRGSKAICPMSQICGLLTHCGPVTQICVFALQL